MPLDLVGKLHRAVYIVNCPESSYEDLARLMMMRCGAVEAWEVMDHRVIIVFESLNSVSNALAFNGISFVDLTKKLVVWRAKDPPPAEAPHQLALMGGSGGAGRSEEENAKMEEERQRWMQQRQRRQETLRGLAAEVERSDRLEMENREEKLKDLCYRQAKALTVLLEEAVAKSKAVLAQQEHHLSSTEMLLKSMNAVAGSTLPQHSSSGAAANADPPLGQKRERDTE